MKEKILNITIGALIGAVVVSSGFLLSVKMNRKIGSLNGMPTMGQGQMQGLNGLMGQMGDHQIMVANQDQRDKTEDHQIMVANQDQWDKTEDHQIMVAN